MVLRFRFHGELNDFLPRPRREADFDSTAGPTDTLKHIIESLGVPHTEIGRVTVNSSELACTHQPVDGDRVEVFPHAQPIVVPELRFVVDGHLGRLAAYLRMLGLDTWYDRFADDQALAAIASYGRRVLLTRDVGLLKRREVEAGYCVRSHAPREQLREVARRYALAGSIAPFRRCMDCNGDLHPVPKVDVAELLPPHTRETKDEFSRCASCRKIYWRGSHHERMTEWIDQLTSGA